jgi:hypothetical protein
MLESILRSPLRPGLRGALRWCVANRALPFSVGAARTHEAFRRGWTQHGPATFNEKLRYKLIYDRRPLVRTISDKVTVRDYVTSLRTDVQLPRLLGVHSTEASVLAAVPTEPWVMKGAHGSGMVLVGAQPQAIPASEIGRLARKWIETDYALVYWEWQYFRLPRRVLFEEHLGRGNEVPPDYKFYVIHQKVRFITVDEGRFTHHTRNLFRPDWTPIASGKGHAKPSAVPPRRPALLGEMIRIAEQLSRETDFVRVDLYVVGQQIYFGELTHAPAAGDLDFQDPDLDAEMGSYWKLPHHY